MSTKDSGEIVSVIASGFVASPDAPWTLAEEKFAASTTNAESMLELLVGEDGNSGYLGALNSAIESRPAVSVTAPTVNTSLTLKTATTGIPTFNTASLGEYPTDSNVVPTLTTHPTVDASGIDGIDKPGSVDTSFTWVDQEFPLDVYESLLPRILADLQSGATGLSPEVEAAIYYRAKERLRVDNEALYEKIHNEWAGKQFMFPSGSLSSALVDFYAVLARQAETLNNDILVAQGDLAQKNSQYIIGQAVLLEQLLRQTAGDKATRELEYKKARATIIIQTYAELVRAYTAELEGERTRVQAQVENLRGVIESNKAKVDIYREQYAALKIQTEAVTAKNQSLVEVFQGQMLGYEAEERGVASANESAIKLLMAKIADAENQVRAAVAQAEQTVAGYSSEQSLKERIAGEMAHIAAQSMAAWANSVNAGVNIGYSGSESRSESISQSKALHESHSYEHDPIK